MEIGCRLRRVETAARARGYLHVIEPRVKGHIVIHEGQGPIGSERLRKIFKGKLMAAGGFEPDTARRQFVLASLTPWLSAATSFLTRTCRIESTNTCRSRHTIATRFTPSTHAATATICLRRKRHPMFGMVSECVAHRSDAREFCSGA